MNTFIKDSIDKDSIEVTAPIKPQTIRLPLVVTLPLILLSIYLIKLIIN